MTDKTQAALDALDLLHSAAKRVDDNNFHHFNKYKEWAETIIEALSSKPNETDCVDIEDLAKEIWDSNPDNDLEYSGHIVFIVEALEYIHAKGMIRAPLPHIEPTYVDIGDTLSIQETVKQNYKPVKVERVNK